MPDSCTIVSFRAAKSVLKRTCHSVYILYLRVTLPKSHIIFPHWCAIFVPFSDRVQRFRHIWRHRGLRFPTDMFQIPISEIITNLEIVGIFFFQTIFNIWFWKNKPQKARNTKGFKKENKEELRTSFRRAKKSTASLGNFDAQVEGEKKEKIGGKRKYNALLNKNETVNVTVKNMLQAFFGFFKKS